MSLFLTWGKLILGSVVLRVSDKKFSFASERSCNNVHLHAGNPDH